MTASVPTPAQVSLVIGCIQLRLSSADSTSYAWLFSSTDEIDIGQLDNQLDRLITLLRERHPLVLHTVKQFSNSGREGSDQREVFEQIIKQDPEILGAVQSLLMEVLKLRQRSSKKFRFDNSVDSSEFRRRAAGGDIYTEDSICIEASSRPFCYVLAEIDPSVIVNRVTTIEVTVSLARLEEWITTATTQSGNTEIDISKLLIVQVLPKANFETVNSDRTELDPQILAQSEHRTVTLYFDVKPTHTGEGEVWVIVRQGQSSLLTLTLAPEIVESRRSRTVLTVVAPSTAASMSSLSKLAARGTVHELPQLSQPLHQLRVFEQRNGTEVHYYYELQSPQLNIWETYRSAPIPCDRQQYVENLYNEIESRWRTAQFEPTSFDAELRAFGGQLFDELFPLKLQQRLWTHRHEIESIMVISTEPFIPWELVHLKQPGENNLPDETCFLGQLGLVRWLHDAGWAPEQIQVRQDRTHYVIPHYPPSSGYRLPQAEAEEQFLQQRLGAVAVAPQPAPVRDLIQGGTSDLLHFACHGNADHSNIANAKLLMQGYLQNDNRYTVNELSATTIEQYSRLNRNGNRPIVVLKGQTGNSDKIVR